MNEFPLQYRIDQLDFIYLPENDIAFNDEQSRSLEYLKNWNCTPVKDIIQAQSLFISKKYLNLINKTKNDSFNRYKNLLEKKKYLDILIRKYFIDILNSPSFSDFYLSNKTKIINENIFWEIIESYDLHDVVNLNDLQLILSKNPKTVLFLMQFNKLSKKFQHLITETLTKNPILTGELILYSRAKADNYFNILFPKSIITNEEKYVKAYIESQKPNINLIEFIINSSQSELKISNEIKVLAKQKFDEVFETLNHIEFKLKFELGQTQKSVIEYKVSDDKIKAYNYILKLELNHSQEKYTRDNESIFIFNIDLLNKLTPPSILNLFIFNFEFVNSQGLSNFPSNCYKDGLIDFLGREKRDTYYHINSMFDYIENELISVLSFLYLNLQIRKKALEKTFLWFFETYLIEEYNISDFKFNFSRSLMEETSETEYKNKCKLLCSALDGILNQYNSLVKNGYINHDALQYSSQVPKISQVNSKIQTKYLYPTQKMSNIIELLLNTYQYEDNTKTPDESGQYTCEQKILEILSSGSIKSDVVSLLQKKSLEELEKFGFIIFDQVTQKYTFPKGYPEIIKNLVSYQTVFYPYLPDVAKNISDKLISEGYLTVGSTLLSVPEQKYFNFVLNKSAYQNGYDIRNKYVHSTHSRDNNVNMIDYMKLVSIVILIIIKINQELEWINSHPNKDN